MKIEDLALQRSKYKHLSDEEWRWFLQQVEGRERTADKLPTFAAIDDWWYPVRLSCEQCSSELTARYKASLLSAISHQHSAFVDLTGGYGVDTYFLSEHFAHTDYVEQNEELCRIAAHNFNVQSDKVQSTKVSVHNTSAENFLKTAGTYDLIYMDPARRDSHGGKVFRLADCSPNVVELLPTLLQHLTPNGQLMFKLSPMLDITQAIKELSPITNNLSPIYWDVYVVAVKNEVKEVLLVGTKGQSTMYKGSITAIDLAEPEKAFTFTREEESNSAAVIPCNGLTAQRSYSPEDGQEKHSLFLYEPSAAILKAGAYKLVAERYSLQKLDVNTHLYCSDTLVENFPGRIWRIQSPITNHQLPINQANVLVRNYPLTPEQLKKKLRVRDGGDTYIIACRVNGKPTCFTAERINH